MICWSCQQKIPDTAKRCPHCEAEAMEEPTADETTAVLESLAGMSPEVVNELCTALEQSETGEEFVNTIMVGDCPKCSSSKTGDCENDPDIEDPCVARCFECGQLWCADCGEFFTESAADHDCPAWEGIDLDVLDDLE